MNSFPTYIDWSIRILSSGWFLTIVGWFLGLLTAWWSGKRLARMQAQTIESLTNAIAAFEDRFKDHLEPLTESEQAAIMRARNLVSGHDNLPVPGRVRLYFRALWPMLVGWFVLTSILGLLTLFVHEAFDMGVLFMLTLGLVGVFGASHDAIGDELVQETQKRLRNIQAGIQELRLNFKQGQHLRQWIISHDFVFLSKGNLLRTVENVLSKAR